MSNSDGFIEEVTEELRRDQMMAKLKKYGWIGVLAVLLIVGGAAYSEYRQAQQRAQAEELGDVLLTALDVTDADQRAAALSTVAAPTPQAAALVSLLAGPAQASAGDVQAAIASLEAVSVNADVAPMYREIAQFKALTLQADTLDVAARKQGFDALVSAGGALRLLAQEQLALIAVEEGDKAGAIAAYQDILSDALVTPALQQRAMQVIVALGGEPDLTGVATDVRNG